MFKLYVKWKYISIRVTTCDMNANDFKLTRREPIRIVGTVMDRIKSSWSHNRRAPQILIVKPLFMIPLLQQRMQLNVKILVISVCASNRWQLPPIKVTVFTRKVNAIWNRVLIILLSVTRKNDSAVITINMLSSLHTFSKCNRMRD